MGRERLPAKRTGWHQKVNIAGQTYYLSAGEYPDGRLGEIWLHAATEGTFVQGLLSALARLSSICLQNGVGVDEVVRSLRHMHFPPHGLVIGSAAVRRCTSVVDWIALELKAAYLQPAGEATGHYFSELPDDVQDRIRGKPAEPPAEPEADGHGPSEGPPAFDGSTYTGGPRVIRATGRAVPDSGEG